jgi:hypothetical protein
MNQLDGSWAVPSPSPSLYHTPSTIGGPLARQDRTHEFSPADFLPPYDCTRVPQRWCPRLPYLPYVFRTPSDPDPPTDDDIYLVGHYRLKEEYIDAIRKFVTMQTEKAAQWNIRMSDLGFNIHNPPDDPFPNEYMSVTLSKSSPSRSDFVHSMKRLLSYAFLCRGYVRWMSRRYVSTVAHEVGKPAPCFGVDERHVGAVFRAGDLSNVAVRNGMKTLERDGVPVFVVRVWKPREESVWNRTSCASLDEPANASGPEIRRISISVQRSYGAVGRPSPWFSRPPNGYPGISNSSFDDIAMLRALRKKYPDHVNLALDMGAFEVLARLLGPGPFFCAREPAPSSSFLSLVNASTPSVIQSMVSQEEWLDPLPTYTPSTLDELKEPHIYTYMPQNIRSAVRGMIRCTCDSH